MRILVLTFYYPPDLSAGAFRVAALMEALRQDLPPGAKVDVITTLPNRYSTFVAEAPEHERHGPVEVFRLQLPSHQSGMLDQSRAFLLFARGARRIAASRSYDLVFATSSRLMTAALGAWIARRQCARLYLDIRDIFVDTINDVLRPLALVLKPLFSVLERWAIGCADGVNLVSGGFLPYFESRYPGRTFTTFTNGIDREFIAAGSSAEQPHAGPGGPLTVLYAGNIGEGQGLHAIVPELARRMNGRARFVVIGDGGRKEQLREACRQQGVTNVELRGPIGRAALIREYLAADVLFLHLNDYPAFEKVLPSKVFEYAALGKPVLAGVSGHAARFIQAEVDNAAVFRPCDAVAGQRALEALDRGSRPRAAFVARYERGAIMRKMAASVLALAPGR